MQEILKEMAGLESKLWKLRNQLIADYPEVFDGKFISNPRIIRRYTVKPDGLYDKGVKWADKVGDYYIHHNEAMAGSGFMYFPIEGETYLVSLTFSRDRRKS